MMTVSYGDLATKVGIPIKSLDGLISSRNRSYRTKHVPKKSGGDRVLEIPKSTLMRAQRALYTNVLSNLGLHSAVHSSISRSHVTHVACHIKDQYHLVIDIKDFFPSITTIAVKRGLIHLGFSHFCANKISKLCTYKNHLPQGAPTSPFLASAAIYKLDVRLKNLCDQRKWVYSRFADDMAISGDRRILDHVSTVLQIIEDENLVVNPKKLQVIPRDSPIARITGINVKRGTVSLRRDLMRNLRAQIHQHHHTSGSLTVSEAKLELMRIKGKVDYHNYVMKKTYPHQIIKLDSFLSK